MPEAFNEAKWFDQSTTASRPGGIAISDPRLEWFRRRLNWGHRYLGVGQVPSQRWGMHLEKGLAEPAIVVQEGPLIVAVYTNEFDCVAMLGFRQGLPPAVRARAGDRLLSINTFERRRDQTETDQAIERDLVPGGTAGRSAWFNVHPAIADFLSEDANTIEARKRQIEPDEWERLETLAAEYRSRFPRRLRQGNPYLSHLPAR